MSSARLFTLLRLRFVVAMGIGSTIFGCSGNKANQRQSAPSDQTSNQNQNGGHLSGTAMDIAPALPSTVSQRTIRTPIVHTELMQHERQHFAYAPSFDPNPVSFDRRNRPYMLRLDGTLPHDPAMLTSNDGGRSWRLATTTDLVNGILK